MGIEGNSGVCLNPFLCVRNELMLHGNWAPRSNTAGMLTPELELLLPVLPCAGKPWNAGLGSCSSPPGRLMPPGPSGNSLKLIPTVPFQDTQPKKKKKKFRFSSKKKSKNTICGWIYVNLFPFCHSFLMGKGFFCSCSNNQHDACPPHLVRTVWPAWNYWFWQSLKPTGTPNSQVDLGSPQEWQKPDALPEQVQLQEAALQLLGCLTGTLS